MTYMVVLVRVCAFAQTNDKYWNAAQCEMICTGKMHNYMRMYWGKRVIEWCADPSVAYSTVRSLL